MSGKYPTTFYRVSLKALIRNDKDEVLVVKEKGSQWSLPGGGMDHGETTHEALTRELYEEVLIDAPFTETLLDTAIMYLESKEAWQLWLVYAVKVDSSRYGRGQDADDVAFIDPNELKNSVHLSEQLVYKFASKHI